MGGAERPGVIRGDPHFVNEGGLAYWRELAAVVDSKADDATRALAVGALGHDRLVAQGWSRTTASATYIGVEATVAVAVAITVLVGHASLVVALGLDAAVAAVVLTAGALAGGMADPGGTGP